VDIASILDQVISHAQATGIFDGGVNGHEPKSSPGNGITCAVWAQRVAPLPLASGLAITTGLLTLNVRIYTPMLAQPYDAIDPAVVAAVDTLLAEYSANFTLGGNVRNIDLLGAFSPGLMAEAGYINQDGKLLRIMTITFPIVINDLYPQVP
jgi:hypothetical protein